MHVATIPAGSIARNSRSESRASVPSRRAPRRFRARAMSALSSRSLLASTSLGESADGTGGAATSAEARATGLSPSRNTDATDPTRRAELAAEGDAEGAEGTGTIDATGASSTTETGAVGLCALALVAPAAGGGATFESSRDRRPPTTTARHASPTTPPTAQRNAPPPPPVPPGPRRRRGPVRAPPRGGGLGLIHGGVGELDAKGQCFARSLARTSPAGMPVPGTCFRIESPRNP